MCQNNQSSSLFESSEGISFGKLTFSKKKINQKKHFAPPLFLFFLFYFCFSYSEFCLKNFNKFTKLLSLSSKEIGVLFEALKSFNEGKEFERP